jgi:hypothetical protein
MATPTHQNPQQMMNRQAFLQRMQMQQGGVQQGSPNNMMGMQNQVMGQGMQQTDLISAQVDALKRQAYQKFTSERRVREQHFIMQHGGNPDAIPIQLKQQFQADEQQRFQQYNANVNLAANQKLNQMRQQQQTQQQQMMMRQQSGLSQGGGNMMQNVAGQMGGNMMGATGPTVNQSMQQYHQSMNAERQKMLMEQRTAAGNMMGPGQGMQGMNMNNMNIQGMNPAMQQPVMNNQQLMQQMRMQQMGQLGQMGMQGMPGQGM